MQKKILNKLAELRTVIFLIMCLCVHVFNAVFFGVIGLIPLAALNVISSILYVLFLTVIKKNENLRISFAYFEIIIFAALSELTSGGHFGYLNYVIGMVAVIFFLLPSSNKKKYVYQFIGAICAVAISQISIFNFSLYPEMMNVVMEYKSFVGVLNLVITLFTLFYLSNLYLIELKSTREKLDYTSNHDMLTGLYNRRFFEGIMKRSKEEKERSFSVAMIDVDDFKKFNDTYGHEVGDKVLELVSWCIKECLPPNAVAVRWGGEEFILYLPLMDNEETCYVMEKLRSCLKNRPVDYKGKKLTVTVTVGVCTGDNISDYEKYIRDADQMLYWGKNHGKNQIVNTIKQLEVKKQHQE